MYKIAIIAPPDCYRESVVIEFMLKVKGTFGNTATILSGGNITGIEHLVKRRSLDYGMKYQEFNPSFTGHNMYSFLPGSYYGKKEHFTQYIHRYEAMLRYTERLVVVKQEDSRQWHIYEKILKKAEREGIKSVLI
jgi:hypothetical protein